MSIGVSISRKSRASKNFVHVVVAVDRERRNLGAVEDL
jgi:hypothetical protein